jgi:hypothetical protein
MAIIPLYSLFFHISSIYGTPSHTYQAKSKLCPQNAKSAILSVELCRKGGAF